MTQTSNEREPVTDLDERLRRIYGDGAVLSKVGHITLVHLDQPGEDVIAERTRSVSASEHFDDCPLCRLQSQQGEYYVFGGPDVSEVPEDESETADPEPVLSAAAEELVRAFDRLDVAADSLICSLEPVATAELLRLAIEHVGFIHDRLLDQMWSEDRDGRGEKVEGTVAQAVSTIEAVGLAHPELIAECTRTDDALSAAACALRRA